MDKKISRRTLLVSGIAWTGGFLLTGCRGKGPQATGTASLLRPKVALRNGTQEMVALLQSIARTIGPNETEYAINALRVQAFRTALQNATDVKQQADLHVKYAIELLNAGQTQASLDEFAHLETQIKQIGHDAWVANKNFLQKWQALGYLRLAEQQNCCSNNTAQSCLLPIRGSGIHTRTEGSTHAIALLEEILGEHPDDLRSRWLLNIAAMTLGHYPDGVPSQWRIPPKVFQADYDIKRFPNVAPQIGMNLLGHAGGCVVDDLDGDNNLDIMVSGLGFQDQLRLFHNNADGTFTERTKEAGLTGEVGGLNLLHADYDNDGHPDVLVLRGGWMGEAGRFPFSLLHNNGEGTFWDVTKQAGLLRNGPTQTAVWFDYNNDGLLDLFIGYESTPAGSHPCALYRNNGDGTFTDVATQAGVDFVGFVKGTISADYDNDGHPDLYLSILGAPNVLFHNNGNGTFTNVAEQAGVTNPFVSFGTFFFDYDNDGWPDLFVMGYKSAGVENVAADYLNLPTKAEYSCLYRNNRDGTFTDVTMDAKLYRIIQGMGHNFGDLDNDGFLDFYAGTGDPDLATLIPNRMFRNAGGKYFQEVTTSGDFGHLQKGHGIAFADLNNDGTQDVFAQMGGAFDGDTAHSALFANPGHGNRWIKLKLEGVQTNRSAIGVRIKVSVRTAAGSREIHRTVGTGGSFGSGPLRQEIGLGQAQSIEKVEIFWPVSRKTQTLSGLALDQAYHVREDKDTPTPIKLKTFAWSKAQAAKSVLELG